MKKDVRKTGVINYVLICSVAGKHIQETFSTLTDCLKAVKEIQAQGETFVGQITILPVNLYFDFAEMKYVS